MDNRIAAVGEKNASIQLLRIVSCIFVVVCHICMNYRVRDGAINYGVLFQNSLARSCVPVFLMISGMFMFRGKSFRAVAVTVVFKIVLPLLLTCVFLQLASPYLLENRFVWGSWTCAPLSGRSRPSPPIRL